MNANTKKMAKTQMINHPKMAAETLKSAELGMLLPCECSKCQQPRLSRREAEKVAAARDAFFAGRAK